MRLTLTITLLLLAPQPAALGRIQQVAEQQKVEARSELEEGAAAYKQRRYADAQRHFERGLALDPTLKIAIFFTARAIHAQYKPGEESPENVAKGREAVAAYQRYLEVEPESDEAYNAVVYLFRAIKDEEREREWLARRAADASATAERRSQAYVVLASKEWQCSYNITERKENMRTVMRRGRAVIVYAKPKDQSDFDQARRCAERGVELIEQGVGLDPDSEQAWSFKTNLLLEAAKLSEMEGDAGRKAEFEERAAEAQRRTQELNERNKKRRAAEARKRAEEEKGQAVPPR